MKSNILTLLALLVTIITVHAVPGLRSFTGYKVYRLTAKSQKQLNALKRLNRETDLDFWTEPRKHGFTDVMANADQVDILFKTVNETNILTSVLIDDVQSLIADQKDSISRADVTEMDWTSYHSYAPMQTWLGDLAASHSEVASVHTIGQSTEGRDLKVMKISTGGTGKKAIFIDAGHHAREWISCAVATYIINELTRNSSQYHSILNVYDIHILKVVNPDGYEYTFTNDRLWRRTRSDNGSPRCRGVDPNRNYDFHYGGEGTSIDKCSEIYRGPKAFSEPETRAVRDYMLKLKAENDCIAYFTMHSYGTYWLTPWGYTSAVPSDYDELVRVANIATTELSKWYGTQYDVGSSTNLLYAAAGGSDDYAKGAVGIPYSYTIELRDNGKNGFVLPASQILPTCIETWNGLQAAIKALKY